MFKTIIKLKDNEEVIEFDNIEDFHLKDGKVGVRFRSEYENQEDLLLGHIFKIEEIEQMQINKMIKEEEQ